MRFIHTHTIIQILLDWALKVFWFKFNFKFIFVGCYFIAFPSCFLPHLTTPLWGKCEDETHIPKSGNLESYGTLKNLELDCMGQNTLHWGVLYTVEKVLKCRCPKWPCMNHLDICNTSYGQKKGRESNWQFDSQPLKVGNRPDTVVCRWSAINH